MSEPAPPAWWVTLTHDVGVALRAPLAFDGRRFFADAAAATATLRGQIVDDGPGSAARLSLYQEQYWMRQFTVLQQCFPRATALCGPFAFNQRAATFLATRPPTEFDLAEIAEGFRDVAAGNAPSGCPQALWRQALSVDEAERRALRAPHVPRWLPSPNERATLDQAMLRLAPSLSLIRLEWDIAERPPVAERPLAPAALSPAQHIVVVRGPASGVVRKVDVITARLLARTQTEPLGAAKRHVLDVLPPGTDGAALLEQSVQRALDDGLWVGMR